MTDDASTDSNNDNGNSNSSSIEQDSDADDEDDDEHDEGDSDSESNSDSDEANEDDAHPDVQATGAEYCEWEDKMMEKKRTVYIFRNEEKLQAILESRKPIPGIVTMKKTDTGEKVHQMYIVLRLPGRSFGWQKVDFDDKNGVDFSGLHFADMQLGEVDKTNCPQSLEGIQSIAQMAALAIPLRYVLGDDHADAYKFCVITNWWKERVQNGTFALPTLDWSLYE